MSHNIKLKMSSCLLYVYSNLTLGREASSRKGLREIQKCLEKETKNPSSAEDRAVSVFAGYMSSVLLHLSVDELPDVELYAVTLPPGIKLFSAYVIAHMAYLKGEYGRALGICEAALMFRDDVYPISMIYLYCMIAMCQMNLKHLQKAKDALMLAWNLAKEDEFWNPLLNIMVCCRDFWSHVSARRIQNYITNYLIKSLPLAGDGCQSTILCQEIQ